jgi:transposase
MDTNIGSDSKQPSRGPYRHHSEEFKRAIVAQSFQPGVSVARLARENGVNTNQVFGWRKRYAPDLLALPETSAPALVPVTIVDQPQPACADGCNRAAATLELTVGRAKLRVEGNVDPDLLGQVLDRLLR